ncbi:MAG: hypothetical protein MSR67_06455 [Oscillospiraceae bacterium]|nr:hypothetical protein [Oscillospiraceae bacterium]
MKKFLAFFLLIAADFWISLAVNFVLAKIIELMAFSIVILLFAIPLQLAAAVGHTFLLKKVYLHWERFYINKVAFGCAAVIPMTLPGIYLFIRLGSQHSSSLGDVFVAAVAIGFFVYAVEAAMGLLIALSVKRRKP